jgi:hypothetical protein
VLDTRPGPPSLRLYPAAINALFASDINRAKEMTYETAAELSGKDFPLLRVSNADGHGFNDQFRETDLRGIHTE